LANRQQRLLGQARPHGLDGPRGGTGWAGPLGRAGWACCPFVFIYFILFPLFLFRHFQQFIFQFMDISLC
jgi:hypothetical protein